MLHLQKQMCMIMLSLRALSKKTMLTSKMITSMTRRTWNKISQLLPNRVKMTSLTLSSLLGLTLLIWTNKSIVLVKEAFNCHHQIRLMNTFNSSQSYLIRKLLKTNRYLNKSSPMLLNKSCLIHQHNLQNKKNPDTKGQQDRAKSTQNFQINLRIKNYIWPSSLTWRLYPSNSQDSTLNAKT